MIVANVTAQVPNIIANCSSPEPEETIAPTTVTPEIALEPDINGVCKVAGTLEINSNPKNTDKISINKISKELKDMYKNFLKSQVSFP